MTKHTRLKQSRLELQKQSHKGSLTEQKMGKSENLDLYKSNTIAGQLSLIQDLFVGDMSEYTLTTELNKEFSYLKYLYGKADTFYFFNSKKPDAVLNKLYRAMDMNRLLAYVTSRKLYEFKNLPLKHFQEELSNWYYNPFYTEEITEGNLRKSFVEFYGKMLMTKRLFIDKLDNETISRFFDDYMGYYKDSVNTFHKEVRKE